MDTPFPTASKARIALARAALSRNPQSANAHFALADALSEDGQYDESAKAFQHGFQIAETVHWKAPRDRDEALALLRKVQPLIERRVCWSPVIAAIATANAFLAKGEEVQRIVDYGRFFTCQSAVVPPGFSGNEFFAQLAAEIKSNLKFYENRRAMRNLWRRNRLGESDQPACRALAHEIHRQVENYLANLPDDESHPFPASKPRDYVIESWAIVSQGESHHKPHIHDRAWLTGVYYVVRPEISRAPGSQHGWLRVGPPPRFPKASGWEERMIAPEPGTLVLMPAYFYHDTQPMGVDQERICVAFDVEPAKTAQAGAEL